MATNTHLEWLRSQLIATEQLLAATGDSLIMRASLEDRIEDLKQQIAEFSNRPTEARLSVWFSGGGVFGSQGIEQGFMESTSKSIVGMINASMRQQVRHLREEHRRANMPKGQFYITALTHGSFGYELAFKDEQYNCFPDEAVVNGIQNVMDVLEVTSEKRPDIEEYVQEQPIQLLGNLKELFTTLKKKNSILKMESGPAIVDLDLPRVATGFDNICMSEVTEKEETIKATLRGAMIDSGKFECRDVEGKPIKGTISEDLSEDEIADLLRNYYGKECDLRVLKRLVKYSNGKSRETVELLGVVAKEPADASGTNG